MRFPTGRGNIADLPRVDILAEMRQNGGSMEAACRTLGLCSRTVLRHLKAEDELAAQIEQARHEGQAARPFFHGRPGSYRTCKCEICRFANTLRMAEIRPAQNFLTCPYCMRRVGVRGGNMYAHHSAAGVVCRGGSGRSRGVPDLCGRQQSGPADDRKWTLAERIEQEIAKGTPTRRIMDLLDVDYRAVKAARDNLAGAS